MLDCVYSLFENLNFPSLTIKNKFQAKATEKKGGMMAFFNKKGDSPTNKKGAAITTDAKKTDTSSKGPVQESKASPKK